MTQQDIIAARLANQQLNQTKFKTAAELVAWFGAVQSQDFPGAKWALGQRLGIRDQEIEQEFNEGKILRTHIMRPTWHFVVPQDITWMEKLTSERVNRIMNYYNKILSLDRNFFDKTNKLITDALSGNKFLTRAELAKYLETHGVSLSGQKLGHTVAQAELDAVICSGPRVGKQFTYALISERIRSTGSGQAANRQPLTPENPLGELTKRYFQSHGPATVRDFVWWSGLTTADARAGIEANKLKSEVIDGKTFYFLPTAKSQPPTPKLFLLPNYDEYTIAYKDREAFLPEEAVSYFHNQGNASFWNAIVFRGEIIGMWKRTFNKTSAEIKTQQLPKFTEEQKSELKKAAEKFGKFFDTKVILS